MIAVLPLKRQGARRRIDGKREFFPLDDDELSLRVDARSSAYLGAERRQRADGRKDGFIPMRFVPVEGAAGVGLVFPSMPISVP